MVNKSIISSQPESIKISKRRQSHSKYFNYLFIFALSFEYMRRQGKRARATKFHFCVRF